MLCVLTVVHCKWWVTGSDKGFRAFLFEQCEAEFIRVVPALGDQRVLSNDLNVRQTTVFFLPIVPSHFFSLLSSFSSLSFSLCTKAGLSAEDAELRRAKAKRHLLGYMRFIAELFNLDIIPRDLFLRRMETLRDRCNETVLQPCFASFATLAYCFFAVC